LSDSRPPKIPPSGTRDNRGPAGGRALTRGRLEACERRLLKRGESNKADLFIVDLDEGPVVVKDFAAKGWWVRLLGRLQTWREARAYERLAGIPGVPRFHGRIDALALAVEWVEARELGRIPDRATNGAARLARLGEILDAIHTAGVAHLDLRARENVLVTAEEELYVVDFAAAVRLRPGGLAHRLWFPWLRSVDESAFLKWKRLLEAGPYTDEERRRLDRHRFFRTLWIFNRRHR